MISRGVPLDQDRPAEDPGTETPGAAAIEAETPEGEVPGTAAIEAEIPEGEDPGTVVVTGVTARGVLDPADNATVDNAQTIPGGEIN